MALGILQEDPWLRTHLEHMINESMTQIIGVPFTCKLSRIDMLGGTIAAVDMHAHAPSDAWSFSCPDTIIQFSWLSYIKRAVFDIKLIFQKAMVFSRYENKQWAVVDPFIKLIRAPITFPIKITGCSFQQSTVHLERDALLLNFLVSSSSDVLKDIVVTRMFVGSGNVSRHETLWADAVSGTITVDVPIENTDDYIMKMQLTADLPFVPTIAKKALLFYAFKNNVGSWKWYPADRTFMIQADALIFDADSVSFDAQAAGSVEKAALYLPFIPILKRMRGTVEGDGHIHMDDTSIEYDGKGRIKDLSWAGVSLGVADLRLKGNKHEVEGLVEFPDAQGIAAKGNWHYDLTSESCETSWTLSKDCKRLQPVIIMHQGTKAAIHHKNGKFSGAYTLACLLDSHEASKTAKKKMVVKGTVESDSARLKLKGTFDKDPYALELSLNPYELLLVSYNNAQESDRTKGINLEKKNGWLEGSINFDYIKDALLHFFGYKVQGQAKVSVKANMLTQPISLDVSLSDGTIKIPEAQNFIKEAGASLLLDPFKKCIHIKDAHIQLQKGSIKSGFSTVHFSDAGGVSFAHLPLIAHNAFISWNKDFFGTLSGSLTGIYNANKKDGRWSCTGMFTLDKGQLKSNVLSSTVHKDLMSNASQLAKNVELDLQLNTRSPLIIKTFFFNTNAEVSASVKGTVADPQVAGFIELNKGALLFPYKHVSLGKVASEAKSTGSST